MLTTNKVITPRANGRTSKNEHEFRVNKVANLLSVGTVRSEIIHFGSSEWGVSQRTVENYIQTAREILKQWKEAATFRTYAYAQGSADNTYFAPEQVNCIHHHYVKWFIGNEANEKQQKEPFNNNKRYAEARLRNLCGHMHIDDAIWAVGLPEIMSHPQLKML